VPADKRGTKPRPSTCPHASYGLISDEGPAAASVVGSRCRRSPAKALDSPLRPTICARELYLSVRTKWNNSARRASTRGFWLRPPRSEENPPLGWRSWRIFYPRARAVCRSLTGVEYVVGSSVRSACTIAERRSRSNPARRRKLHQKPSQAGA